MLALTPGVVPLTGAGGNTLPLLDDRLVTTLLGSAIALLAALALWRAVPVAAVRGRLAAALRALVADTPGGPGTPDGRRAALTALLDAGDCLHQALTGRGR